MKPYSRYVLLLLAVTLSLPSVAQVKDLQFSDRLESARKMYYNGSYYAAEKAFTELSLELDRVNNNDKFEVEAFKVLCAISADKINAAGLVRNFCEIYPNAPQKDMLKHALASRYFDRGEYREALDLIDTIDERHIDRSQRTEFSFKKAYCNMYAGKHAEAADSFKKILASEYSNFTIPSTYYLGYVSYMDKDFGRAAELFEKCFDDSRFSLMSKYYAVECNFMQKNYQYVLSNGPALMPQLERDLQSNLAKILSETYYADGQPNMAQEYLDLYRKSGSDFSRKDHYFSGILSYSLKDYQDAVNSFSRVVGVDDDLSQNANYYSANSYLQLKNKIAAMNSFKAASEGNFDANIKEDAMFNYAKLCFDVNADISQFQKYMSAYPDNGKDDIINGYMAKAYLESKDYRSAVDMLGKIRHHTKESSANLQKASFFRAMQLIDNRGYRSAVPMLEKSLASGGGNESLENIAKYWLAECYYRNDRYAEAKALNDELLSSSSFRYADEYPNVLYNQAYCNFKSGDFASAQQYFDSYINGSFRRKAFERDAKVRLADSYFMQGNYSDASQLYETIYMSDYAADDVYPAYQASIAYGLLGNNARKISLLKQVVKNNRNSQLYPQSLFELGRTYVQTGRDDDATETFYTLLAVKSDSTYYAKTLLELAMINANNKKYDRAVEYYKTLISDCPRSEEVQDALSGMESIYQAQNRPEDFLAYIDKIGMSSLKTADEKELMIFEAAEQTFLSGKYPAAQTALLRFLKSYPDGAKAAHATYYLAECYRAQGQMEKALDTYMKVMQSGDTDLTEAATANYAKISYELQHFDKAIIAYENLASIARTEEAKLSAYLGRMRACYDDKQYAGAVKDAQRLISNPATSPAMNREAQYVMAKSYLTMGERDMATPLFENLSRDCSDAYGAESAYFLIQDAYDNGEFQDVEKRVYAFADAGTNQMYWLARSFVVLGDSFADRDDFDQAKATFESILEGYSADDDIVEQVRARLNLLNNMKKK